MRSFDLNLKVSEKIASFFNLSCGCAEISDFKGHYILRFLKIENIAV